MFNLSKLFKPITKFFATNYTLVKNCNGALFLIATRTLHGMRRQWVLWTSDKTIKPTTWLTNERFAALAKHAAEKNYELPDDMGCGPRRHDTLISQPIGEPIQSEWVIAMNEYASKEQNES